MKKNITTLGKIIVGLVWLLPGFIHAQAANFYDANFAASLNQSTNEVTGLIGNIVRAANTVFPLLLAVALVVFIWGIIKYVLAQAAEKKNDAKNIIIYGVISISVLLSVFGLANFLLSFFGLTTGTAGIVPIQAQGPLALLVNSALSIINSFIPLLLAVGVIIFFGGMIRNLYHSDNVKYRDNGRDLMIYGVITIAVILSVWGLGFLIKDTFFQDQHTPFFRSSVPNGVDYCVPDAAGIYPVGCPQNPTGSGGPIGTA